MLGVISFTPYLKCPAYPRYCVVENKVANLDGEWEGHGGTGSGLKESGNA